MGRSLWTGVNRLLPANELIPELARTQAEENSRSAHRTSQYDTPRSIQLRISQRNRATLHHDNGGVILCYKVRYDWYSGSELCVGSEGRFKATA